MLIKKEDSKKFSIPGGTDGWLYPSNLQSDQTIAYVEMDGVYPEKGYSINDVCTETFFVVEGNLTIYIDDEVYELEKGDVIIVSPGKKYNTRGKAKIIDFITPSWEKNNNQIIQ
jgi:mannose-6-phosphate isomerase-like protein (cupin superfamily)